MKFSYGYDDVDEGIKFLPFNYNIEQVSHLRYRCEDIYNGIKKSDIQKAKVKKINQELLQSSKMKSYFENNPQEKQIVLNTIANNSIKNFKPSASYLPSYLIHEESNFNPFANAINKQYKEKNITRRNKKGKMEQYLEALDKNDGSANMINF